jgi:hypothetical protein
MELCVVSQPQITKKEVRMVFRTSGLLEIEALPKTKVRII